MRSPQGSILSHVFGADHIDVVRGVPEETDPMFAGITDEDALAGSSAGQHSRWRQRRTESRHAFCLVGVVERSAGPRFWFHRKEGRDCNSRCSCSAPRHCSIHRLSFKSSVLFAIALHVFLSESLFGTTEERSHRRGVERKRTGQLVVRVAVASQQQQLCLPRQHRGEHRAHSSFTKTNCRTACEPGDRNTAGYCPDASVCPMIGTPAPFCSRFISFQCPSI